jgi:SAM-dependent methyltransferase
MPPSLPAELQAAYDRRFAPVREYRQGVWRILIREFFQPLIPVASTVLDLGCGWGEFVNEIRAARKFAMDLNPSTGEHLSGDVTFLHQDCSQRWAIEDGALDIVFTSNFFEHLPTKAALRSTLTEAHRTLRQGGRLVCLGPNIKHIPGSYWDFWDHHLPLTELALKEVLELVGFRVERSVGRFLPYTMASGIAWPTAFVTLYLRLPILWPVFGRQFLVIAVKP